MVPKQYKRVVVIELDSQPWRRLAIASRVDVRTMLHQVHHDVDELGAVPDAVHQRRQSGPRLQVNVRAGGYQGRDVLDGVVTLHGCVVQWALALYIDLMDVCAVGQERDDA